MSVQIVKYHRSTGYQPRPFQQILHNSVTRFSVVCCHRRFGKTVMAVNHLIHHAVHCRLKNPRFAYIFPFYQQAHRVAWMYLKEYTSGLVDMDGRPRFKIHESDPVKIELISNNALIEVLGADKPKSLKGTYLDGVVLDEYAEMRENVWGEVIRPQLSDRKGWALFVSTPHGKNSFYRLYDTALNGRIQPNGERIKDKNWSAFLFKASETNVIDTEEMESMLADMTPEQVEQELECNFDAAVVGSYYGTLLRELEKQKRFIEADIYEPQLPVHTSWDLGIGDSTAIWMFQIFGKEVRIIDYYEAHGHGLEHYVKVLQDRGYKYGNHWLPHDAKIRELGTGRTRVETLTRLGIVPNLIPRMEVADGINAVRLTLPHCWFSAKKCEKGIEALKMYRREKDDKNNSFKDKPLHDWTSHAADAFRYLASAWQAQLPKPVEDKRPEGITLNDLFRAKENRPDNYRIN